MLTIFLCLRHPPDMFEWTIAVREDGQRTLTIFGGKEDTTVYATPKKIRSKLVNQPSIFCTITLLKKSSITRDRYDS